MRLAGTVRACRCCKQSVEHIDKSSVEMMRHLYSCALLLSIMLVGASAPARKYARHESQIAVVVEIPASLDQIILYTRIGKGVEVACYHELAARFLRQETRWVTHR